MIIGRLILVFRIKTSIYFFAVWLFELNFEPESSSSQCRQVSRSYYAGVSKWVKGVIMKVRGKLPYGVRIKWLIIWTISQNEIFFFDIGFNLDNLPVRRFSWRRFWSFHRMLVSFSFWVIRYQDLIIKCSIPLIQGTGFEYGMYWSLWSHFSWMCFELCCWWYCLHKSMLQRKYRMLKWSVKRAFMRDDFLISGTSDCPCEINCLDGCDGCDNPVCDCQVSLFAFISWELKIFWNSQY